MISPAGMILPNGNDIVLTHIDIVLWTMILHASVQ